MRRKEIDSGTFGIVPLVLIGGGGMDTCMMGYGSGSDVIVDSSASGGIVKLGPNVTLSDMSAARQGNDLLLNAANDFEWRMKA